MSDDLHEFLIDAHTPQSYREHPEAFQITDDEGAGWAMHLLATASSRVESLIAEATAEKARIDAWLTRATKGDQSTVEKMTELLRAYAVRVRDDEKDGRATIELPYGTLSTRMTQPSSVVADEQAFLEWAKANKPEWLRIKPEVDKTAINAGTDVLESGVIDKATGEMVPGLGVKPGGYTPTVKPERV